MDRTALAGSILRTLSDGDERITFSPEVHDLFYRHGWPGNIRQMANVIRTALALRDGENEIRVEHLPEDFLEQAGARTVASHPLAGGECEGGVERLEDLEAAAIRDALKECSGNVSAAARKLGVSRSTLYRKAKGNPELLT